MQAIVKKSSTVSGVAKVIVGESRVKLIFRESEDTTEFTGQQFRFDLSDVPEYVKKSGTYYASVSESGDRFYGMRPLKGIFKTKFSHFWARENEPPAPRQETGKFGPYLSFTAVLEISAGEFDGMEIPVKFIYKFIETDDGLAAISVGTKKGNAGERLVDFLEVAGVGDVQIPFSDNVLPKLQKALLKAGVEFMTALKDGWAEYFMDSMAPTVEDDDEDEEDEGADQSPRTGKGSKKAVPASDDDEDGNGAPKGKLKPVVEDDDDEEPRPVKKAKKSELSAFDDDDVPF